MKSTVAILASLFISGAALADPRITVQCRENPGSGLFGHADTVLDTVLPLPGPQRVTFKGDGAYRSGYVLSVKYPRRDSSSQNETQSEDDEGMTPGPDLSHQDQSLEEEDEPLDPVEISAGPPYVHVKLRILTSLPFLMANYAAMLGDRQVIRPGETQRLQIWYKAPFAHLIRVKCSVSYSP